MKLRRNVLQPLRLELEQQPLTPANSCHATQGLDQRQIHLLLRNAFSASADTHLLPFAGRPMAMLKEYSEQRQESVAGKLFRTANRIQSSIDTVVVLCQGNAGLGAKAIAHACCQPFWNHLSRADRGSKPRMFFLDDRSDNDTVQGLLHLLGCHRPATTRSDLDHWALMVLASEESASDHSEPAESQPEEMWQLEALLTALQKHVANTASTMSRHLMAVSPTKGAIAKRLSGYGEYDFFASYNEPAALQCFGPLGLLPATLLGVNIMELLAGASWMSQHFHQASPEENLILRLLNWLARNEELNERPSQLRIWNPALSGWQDWYRDLCRTMIQATEVLRPVQSLKPTFFPNARVGEINVVVERPRFDPLGVGGAENAQERMRAKIDQHLRSNRDRGVAVAEIRLAELDELHMGQWMQFMLLLSASSRIMGMHPPVVDSSRMDDEHGVEATA